MLIIHLTPPFSGWNEPRWAYSPTRVRVPVRCNGILGPRVLLEQFGKHLSDNNSDIE
jgi:hypothetical protein